MPKAFLFTNRRFLDDEPFGMQPSLRELSEAQLRFISNLYSLHPLLEPTPSPPVAHMNGKRRQILNPDLLDQDYVPYNGHTTRTRNRQPRPSSIGSESTASTESFIPEFSPSINGASPQNYAATSPSDYSTASPSTYSATSPSTYAATPPNAYAATSPNTYAATSPSDYSATSADEALDLTLDLSSSSSASPSPGSPPEAISGAHSCIECGKRYSTSSNLARHRQIHRSMTDKKARACPQCGKVYVSMPAYSMHVRTHKNGCECPFCGKRFSRPWLLQGHIRTHTGEKPFACDQCHKAFADKSNLRAHVQTHSLEKPFVCSHCGKAFALKSYLYKHEESSCFRGQQRGSSGQRPQMKVETI